jgi:hypothetical protein
MKPSVYIESSIVSYLVARPSRDAAMAHRQRQTRDWWENRRAEYRLFSSELVLREVLQGEPEMARERVASMNDVSLLRARPEAESLARALVEYGPLPANARPDAGHIAMAAVAGLDYLLTWNSKHIANPRMYPKIARLCRDRGFAPPVLCTPDALLRRWQDDG